MNNKIIPIIIAFMLTCALLYISKIILPVFLNGIVLYCSPVILCAIYAFLEEKFNRK